MQIEIRTKKTGNCPCAYCDKVQDGLKMHPFTLWYKDDGESRGHNLPVCSIFCAKSLKRIYERSNR